MMNWKEFSSDEERAIEAILIALDQHRYLIDFLFEPNRPRLRAASQVLIDDSKGYSSGEQLLIRVALDLWCSEGEVKAMELLGTLDEQNFENAILAIVFLGSNVTYSHWQGSRRVQKFQTEHNLKF